MYYENNDCSILTKPYGERSNAWVDKTLVTVDDYIGKDTADFTRP